MKIWIVRHGDPDYERDSLTPVGWREAELLAGRLSRGEYAGIYVSPLGRARDTAAPSLRAMGREAVECGWLREFHAPIRRPDVSGMSSVCWDWLPQDWLAEPRFLDPERWHEPSAMAGVKEEYDRVAAGLDEVLAAHGYRRDGRFYRAERPNAGTLLFFCHFGVGCVMLSHLLNISPMALWHGLCAAPSSVTTVVTEERRQGIASWRMGVYGDVSHLTAAGEEPSFSARFCERFTDGTRHD